METITFFFFLKYLLLLMLVEYIRQIQCSWLINKIIKIINDIIEGINVWKVFWNVFVYKNVIIINVFIKKCLCKFRYHNSLDGQINDRCFKKTVIVSRIFLSFFHNNLIQT